jgi:glycerol transport system permease protein
VFVGTDWFAAVMRDEELHAPCGASCASRWRCWRWNSLGIALALSMPAAGWRASVTLVIVALSLLIPWNVVGTIWQIFGRTDIGLLGHGLERLGIDYSYTGDATQAWLTVLLMDVWHWTPLVALLATRACAPSRRLLPGRASTGPASWPCSATSSCPRCAAC